MEQVKYGKENNSSQRNVKYTREMLSKTAHLATEYKYTLMYCRWEDISQKHFFLRLSTLLENNSWSKENRKSNMQV